MYKIFRNADTDSGFVGARISDGGILWTEPKESDIFTFEEVEAIVEYLKFNWSDYYLIPKFN